MEQEKVTPRATPERGTLAAALAAVRPKQWVKNGFVFAAPLFAYALDPVSISLAIAAFGIFCALSGGTYLVNDLFDQEQDRLHPVKKNRPIAAGQLSPRIAWLMAAALFAGGVAGAIWMGLPMVLVVAGYMLAQLLYNLSFKHILILDVMTLASGFVLRAVAGGLATEVPLSPWFLFCVALLAFYLGLAKRKGELRRVEKSGVTTRKILKQYSLAYMEQVETAILACILLSYALWSIQAANTHWMMLSIPFVFYGILRYQYLSNVEGVERPEEALFRDRPLLVNVALWVAACFIILSATRA